MRYLGVICYDRWVLSEDHKNCLEDWCLMNSQPTFLFLTYFNSMNYGCIIKRMTLNQPDNFESHNSLKLSFTNFRGLRSSFVDCESFLASNFSDILAL